MPRLLLCLICLMAIGVNAETLYKCESGGQTIYQGTPCASGKASTVKKPAPYDPGAARQIRDQMQREQIARQEAGRKESAQRLEAARLRLIEARAGALEMISRTDYATPANVSYCAALADRQSRARQEHANQHTEGTRQRLMYAEKIFRANNCQ